jgi:hypothetical protein
LKQAKPSVLFLCLSAKKVLTVAFNSHDVMLSNLKQAKPSVLFFFSRAQNSIDGGN